MTIAPPRTPEPSVGLTTRLSARPESPSATRSRRRGWRDPRLALGLVLVAGCGLLGAKTLAAADRTTTVVVLRHPLVAGQSVTADDLDVRRVHFSDAHLAAAYVADLDAVPSDTVTTRDLSGGELLPRAALGSATGDRVELPLAVPAASLPSSVRLGSTVDVWVTAKDSGDAVLALDDVPVSALGGVASTLSPTAERQIVVGLDEGHQKDLPTTLALLAGGTVVLTRESQP